MDVRLLLISPLNSLSASATLGKVPPDGLINLPEL